MLKFRFGVGEDCVPILVHDFADVFGSVEYGIVLFAIVNRIRNIFDSCVV